MMICAEPVDTKLPGRTVEIEKAL
jgi:hypothetical protein